MSRLSDRDIAALISATHPKPRSVLGYHEFPREGDTPECVIRVLEPDAESVAVYWEDETPEQARPLVERHPSGIFEGTIDFRRPIVPYRLHIRYRNGAEATKYDPYYFAPQLTEYDLHLFGEGNHHQIYRKLGAHPMTRDGLAGTRFAVWAPNAKRVSVVGDFNFWDGRRHPMHPLGNSGIWELFIPGVGVGALYKYEILTRYGSLMLKADPYGFQMQLRPDNASIVADLSGYEWGDGEWMERRRHWDPLRAPISIYEVHPGSWRRSWHRRPAFLTWDELADQLIPYVLDLGYTHIELIGVAEHPFDGSWGYQVLGHYAPTARHGTPKDFMRFVDRMHQAGIGVFMDWVPAHFPKDAHGLREFDGTALYEHEDPRLGDHSEWGTKIFNYGRHEVRNFLVANALFWLEQYHIDGLRVDAVASMLYLDYARKPGEWVPNKFGGRENLEAIDFLKQLNWTVGHYFPGALMMAEESTAFPGVSRPVHLGGLGFHFKWNMGWMNDTLRYMSLDPIHRRHHHDLITFSLVYAFSEHFILPLSHDEVVHGKRSLLDKMPGDEWRKRANYRLLLGYMMTHPGKKLLFMGGEFGQWHEWRDYEDLAWASLEHPSHRQLQDWNRALNLLYRQYPELHASDDSWEGFRWIDADNRDESVFAFLRQRLPNEGGTHLIVAFNATPVPRDGYVLGVLRHGRYRKILDSDDPAFGGSGYAPQVEVHTEEHGWRDFPARIRVNLPPLAMVVWEHQSH
ncbi:MAG TPA: 1,4-alpha-glucan branching protein GlgB [Steroidobacteraceae bacterium]